MPRPLSENEKSELEQLIDKTSLHSLLAAVSEICLEKAEHMRVNWSSEYDSKTWEHMGRLTAALDNMAVERGI